MKSNYDPVLGTSADDADPEEWENFVDKTSTAQGWLCRICHCLLASSKNVHAKAHIDWHQQTNGR